MKRSMSLGMVVLVCAGFKATTTHAQPLATGYVTKYRDVTLDGKECVVAARDMSIAFLRGRTFPLLGENGVAADLWTKDTPDFFKRANTGSNFPPINGSLIVWNKQLYGGAGHVAFPIAVIDQKKRIVRVVDGNWGFDKKGQIHDIVLDGKVAGWLIPR